MHTLKPDSLELSHSWTFAAAVPIYMPFDTEMCNMQTQKVMSWSKLRFCMQTHLLLSILHLHRPRWTGCSDFGRD